MFKKNKVYDFGWILGKWGHDTLCEKKLFQQSIDGGESYWYVQIIEDIFYKKRTELEKNIEDILEKEIEKGSTMRSVIVSFDECKKYNKELNELKNAHCHYRYILDVLFRSRYR